MKKKILIITKNQLELSSEEVMDWIWLVGHQVVRLNGDRFEGIESKVKVIQQQGDISLHIDNVNLEDFDVVWLRRWSDASWLEAFDRNLPFEISNGTVTNIAKELAAVRELLFHRLKGKMKLTNSKQLSVNKLIVFEKASKVGFTVPDYLITNNREELKIFYRKHGKIVCKDIDTPLIIQSSQEQVLSYVELIDEEFIDCMPEMFMLSIFQAYIEKEIEIRSFVLNEEIYSMAIFSQGDTKTSVDFRKYNTIEPNRNVPYKLPEKEESQIKELMNQLDLKTGSIDLIKNTRGEFIFLEVNPVGQFGMVSYPCNYNLEQRVAEFLYA